MIDLHAWVGCAELLALSEDKRVDENIKAIALDKALITVSDQKGKFAFTLRETQVFANFEQLIEVDAFDEVDV